MEIIKVLLDSGADVNWKNRNGKTAYDVAGDPEVKELLRKARRR